MALVPAVRRGDAEAMRILRRRRPLPPVDVAGATDPGPRPDNQDRWAVGPGWALVCDGVGGHRGGATAAEAAVAAARRHLPADPTAAARAANAAVVAGRSRDPDVADMATTLTTAVRTGPRSWTVVQVGDSPAWVVGLDPEAARAVTWDHNVVGDLVRAGALTAEEAVGHRGRHVVTRAIGIAEEVEPESFVVDLSDDEALVLASDGLSDVVVPADAVPVVAAAPTAEAAAHGLVALALARGTRDNVTAVVVR